MRFVYSFVAILLAFAGQASQLDGSFTLRTSERNETRVHLTLQSEATSNYGRTIERAAFTDVVATGDRVKFVLRRAPGTLTFEGRGSMERAAGWYDFAPNADFQRELERIGFGDITTKTLFVFALEDLTLEKVKRLQTLVSDKLDTTQLVRLINHGAGPDYVQGMAELGFQNLTSDEYRRARDHGVSPDFVRGMRELGMNLTLGELIRARDHGATPAFIQRMREFGFDALPLSGYIRLRDHGVSPEFVESMREVGYATVTAEELVRLRDHGVSANFVKRVKELFKTTPTVDEIIRFRTRGDIDWAK